MTTKLNARKMLKVLQQNVTEAREALVKEAQNLNRQGALNGLNFHALVDLVQDTNRAETLLHAAVGSPDLSDARD